MQNTDLWYQLPPDMQAWNNAILDNISQKVPTITDYLAGIEWSKLDPATGDADGIIQLLNGLCAAPITIRGNRLAPIDVLVSNYGTEPKFYPLSDKFLQKIYADNVLGQPAKIAYSNDEDFIGPSVKIKNIKTVDTIKHASVESAQQLLDAIQGSVKVANWMVDNMPETVLALSERAADTTEKVASIIEELPDLMTVWKEGDRYFANGNETSADVIADFCKIANVTDDEKIGLMNGERPIVRDYREKVASVHIPSEQDVLSIDVEDEFIFGEKGAKLKRNPDISIANVYFKDGSTSRSVIISPRALNVRYRPTVPEQLESESNPQVRSPEIEGNKYYDSQFPELIIFKDGYGLQRNPKTDPRSEFSLKYLKEISAPSEMAIGLIGLFLNESVSSIACFGRIDGISVLGNLQVVRVYDLINHEEKDIHIRKDSEGNIDTEFYEVPDNRVDPVTTPERTQYVSISGINGIVKVDSDGKIVIDGISHSVVNCPFALMSKYAMAYDDAVDITKVAKALGKCEFEVYMEKDSAVMSGDEDHTKRNNKKTKSGTDDESNGPSALAQTTPEAAMSFSTVDPSAQFSRPAQGPMNNGGTPVGQGNTDELDMGYGVADQEAEGMMTAPTQDYTGLEAGYMEPNAPGGQPPSGASPVTTKDLETAVQLNSPKIMDAYVMAGLSHGDLNAREGMMRTNESILKALEQLSKLLFLVRQGGIDYVSESDLQAAMQKLTDIADTLGVNTPQIGA